MKVEKTIIPGVLILTPRVFEDERGFFLESYNRQEFEQNGITAEFVQDNHSKSSKGTIRGLHFQKAFPQGKLIRAIRGEVLDVILDIRKGSPAYKKWISVLISEENKKQVWIPGGLAHGFSVLSETAEFCYKVDEYYHPEDEGGIRWNDPGLGIDWDVSSPKLSEKDQALPLFGDVEDQLPVFKSDSL
jgi:dTDP-4-dehydrorhamnose 3,5-epimerase